MAPGPEADSLPDEEGLAELVRRIQIGDQAAIRDLHSTFATGIEFLLRRKLGKSSVSTEAAAVLETAVQEIQSSSTLNLRSAVAHAVNRLFPPRTPGIDTDVADPYRQDVAHAVLAARPPLERDILRRYYVLRESTATIRSRLHVSSATIEKALAGARAEFRRRMHRTDSA